MRLEEKYNKYFKFEISKKVTILRNLLIAGVLITFYSFTYDAKLYGQNNITQNSFRLNECLVIALEMNPSLKARLFELDAAKANLKEYRGSLLPMLNVSSAYNRFSDPYENGSYTDNSVGNIFQQSFLTGGVTIQQPLFTGFRLSSEVSIAESGYKESEYRYESYLQDVMLNVKKSYYNLVVYQRLIRVVQKSVEQTTLYLEAAKERSKLGLARPVDVLKAEVELSNAKLQLIDVENSVLNAQGDLNKELGSPVTESIIAVDILGSDQILNNELDLKTLILMAEKNLPELLQINMQIQAQKASVKLANSVFMPSLTAGANYTWYGNTISKMQGNWSAGIALNMTIFNGFSSRANVSKQKAILNSHIHEKEQLRQKVALTLRKALLNVKKSQNRIYAIQLLEKNAQKNLEIAEIEYQEGLGSMLELVDAQTAYISAQQDYILTQADLQIARAELDRKIGKLNVYAQE